MIHAATDEVLERLWYAAEEARTPSSLADFNIDANEADLRDALDTLVTGGWIESAGGYRLSSSGATRARGIVRRHRLAEVLFELVAVDRRPRADQQPPVFQERLGFSVQHQISVLHRR